MVNGTIEFDDKSGEIRIDDPALKVTIRRPLFGEIRTLMEANQARFERMLAASAPAPDPPPVPADPLPPVEGDEPPAVPEPDPLPTGPPVLSTAFADSVAATLLSISGCIDWWCTVIDLLGEVPVATRDELPSWLGDPQLIGLATDHWIMFPTRALGASSLLMGSTPRATED